MLVRSLLPFRKDLFGHIVKVLVGHRIDSCGCLMTAQQILHLIHLVSWLLLAKLLIHVRNYQIPLLSPTRAVIYSTATLEVKQLLSQSGNYNRDQMFI